MAISTQTEALLELYNQKISSDTTQLQQINYVQTGYTIQTGIGETEYIKVWGPQEVIDNYKYPIEKLDNRIIQINNNINDIQSEILNIGQTANSVGCGTVGITTLTPVGYTTTTVYQDQLNYVGYSFSGINPFSSVQGRLISGISGAGNTDTQIYNTISDVNSNLLSVDVYGFTGGFNPVVIYIHGGGFALGDKSAVDSKATFFNNLGYVFVSVNHRLSPASNLLLPYGLFVGDNNTVGTASTRVKHTNHVTDCANAIAWVYNNISKYGGNNNKLVLMGHSSGAILASLLVTNQSYLTTAGVPPSKILGCISNDTESYNVLQQILNPIQDGDTVDQQKMAMNAFGIYPDKTVTGTATTITTDFATKAAAEAVYATGSPILNISTSTPPFLVLRRGASERIARETEFVTALQSAGRTVTAVSYPGDTTYTHLEINESIGAANDPPAGKTLPSGVSNVSTVIQNWITDLAPIEGNVGIGTYNYVTQVAIGSYFDPVGTCSNALLGCTSGICSGYGTSITNLSNQISTLQTQRNNLITKANYLKNARINYQLQNYAYDRSKEQINTSIGISSTIIDFLEDPNNAEWL